MRTRRVLGMALVVLCAGLVAAPAQSAERRAPAPGSLAGAVAAARLWLGELLGSQAFDGGRGGEAGRLVAVSGADEQSQEEGGAPAPPSVAGIFKLKAYVDNPGQTP